MIHQYDFPGVGHNSGSRRLCGSTDREGLVEHVAEQLWQSREPDGGWPWADAGDHWQHIYRGFAETAIASIRQRADR